MMFWNMNKSSALKHLSLIQKSDMNSLLEVHTIHCLFVVSVHVQPPNEALVWALSEGQIYVPRQRKNTMAALLVAKI